MTLVLTQLFHALECRSETRGLLSADPFGNPALLAACAVSALCVAAAVWLPPVSALFQTAPLSAAQLRLCLVVSALAPVASAVFTALQTVLPDVSRKKRAAGISPTAG